ncbi:MAG TPA: THUMP domain-containing protein [Patescibacteria group bacterium]|nr:THUMP domain-containing protein [Patescibacteria group bacterium]
MSSKNETHTLVAKTLFGLEDILSAELEALGAQEVTTFTRAVRFEGDTEMMYRANLHLRTALRILLPIHSFSAENEKGLYDGMQELDWSEILKETDTLAIDAAVSSQFFNHSKYVTQLSKDAIVDQFREKTGVRPSVDLDNPTVRLNIHIFEDECTVSLDSSGDSLHKRGYRTDTNIAPLNEVLAAGLVLLSGWTGQSNLVDPMCGSGTILIEAAMLALKIPPQMFRKNFGFKNWPDFDAELWAKVLKEANDAVLKEFPHQIVGSDISLRTIEIARDNIRNAGLEKFIKVEERRLEHTTPPEGGGFVLMNPPYGERLTNVDVEMLYKQIGDVLKQKYKGYEAWLLTSNREALKAVGLRTSRKIPLYNGPLECRFVRYDLYEGTKKVKRVE